jgi:hypothetical protein
MMLSSTLIHVAIDWDGLPPIWRYATIDANGIWAHAERPMLNDDGYYTSEGSMMYLSPAECVLFERGHIEPIEPHAPSKTLPNGRA